MTKTQRIVFILISVCSALALANGIKLAAIYYHLAAIGNIENHHFIELSQAELMTLPKEKLAESLSSYMELSQDKDATVSKIYGIVFYTILALVVPLKISVIYNWWLVKNTHNKALKQDK
ncbi:hypothetical protein RI844_13720 [Thalassotalea fonticola]|uniref:Uncharacterized protein n=1 Tax=Thalassotalea fonticola TaxID=3065649 RepID=A0ABZ0GLY5_9GAMM|nr:hypothetical protein RI844_13720 [Colwelliaceae bacterium S1-1]